MSTVQKTYNLLYQEINRTTDIDTAIAAYITALTAGQVGIVEAIEIIQSDNNSTKPVAVITMSKHTPLSNIINLPVVTLADISTGAATAYAFSPVAGTVTQLAGRVSADPGADTVISLDVDGGTASTDTLTLPNESTAAVTQEITDNNVVALGSRINLTSDNGATNAVSADFIIQVTLA